MEVTITDIIAAGGATGAVVTMWKFIVKPTMCLWKRWARALNLIDDIAIEFKPNGGNSLRDAVNRIERRVHITELRGRALLQDTEHGIVETSSDGKLVWTNRTLQRWTGKTLDQTRGQGWIQVIHPKDRQRVINEWQNTVDQYRDSEQVFRIITPDGGDMEICAKNYVIMPSEGEHPLGWISILHEMSDTYSPATHKAGMDNGQETVV